MPTLAVIVLMLIPAALYADAIVVTRAMTATTIAEVFIEEDSMRVDLEVGLADLDAFRNLLPDPLYERLGHEPEPLVRRVGRFFREDFMRQPDGGAPLGGRIIRMEARARVVRDEITGDPLPTQPDSGETVVSISLVYRFERRPETLTISPPRSGSGYAVANIGFVVYHEKLPVTDFRYLGSQETLQLDWSDPWYSRFENRNLRRQFDSPVSAFLYVEPYEVRKEIVLRPKDLEHWLDLGLGGKDVITVAEQAEIKRRISEFLAAKNPVTIDDAVMEGELDRIHFIRRTLRRTGVIDPPEDLDAVSATLGVIFVYPTSGLPAEATLTWELFNPRIQRLPAIATDEAGGLPYFLTAADPVLVWQNFLVNPTIPGLVEVGKPPQRNLPLAAVAVLAGVAFAFLVLRYGRGAFRGQRPSWPLIGAAGALALIVAFAAPLALRSAVVSDEESGEIVGDLLRNVYRAFDYRDESRIYDLLEQSASGELLTEIFLETRRSLEIENQGGARAKVQEVEVLESTAEALRGESGFLAHCIWNVSGSIGHWGHIHRRTNQYEARVTIEAIDGSWRITELELLQEQRL
jgi:hypothetical protein